MNLRPCIKQVIKQVHLIKWLVGPRKNQTEQFTYKMLLLTVGRSCADNAIVSHSAVGCSYKKYNLTEQSVLEFTWL